MTKTAALLLAALAAAPALADTPIQAKGAKLPTQLKIDPSALKALQLPPPPTTLQQFDAAAAAVKAEAERFGRARTHLEEREQACETRTYSSQDMREAGCLDTDSVAACTAKLYHRCTSPSRRAYRLRHRSFSAAIESLDQKARALAIPPETP